MIIPGIKVALSGLNTIFLSCHLVCWLVILARELRYASRGPGLCENSCSIWLLVEGPANEGRGAQGPLNAGAEEDSGVMPYKEAVLTEG